MSVIGAKGIEVLAEVGVLAVGIQPNSELGAAAGLKLGVKGALSVDRQMRTNVADVLAAGDCVETWHRLLGRYTWLPLGTTSHKRGVLQERMRSAAVVSSRDSSGRR